MDQNAILHPSPYLCIGNEEFENARGKRVTPVFRSSDATFLTVSTPLADLLRNKDIRSDELSSAQRGALLDSGLLCEDQTAARSSQYNRISTAVDTMRSRMFVL